MAQSPKQNTTFSATSWLLLLRWVSRGLGLIRTIVLAALLTPEDYGIGILALTIVLFVEACTSLQANYLIVRTTETRREFYDSAWTLDVLRGLATGGLMIALAGAIAGFFEEASLTGMIYLLGFSVLIGGFRNIGMAEYSRHMAFSQTFLLGALSRLFAFVAAVGTAIAFETYWAIAIGFFVQRIAEVAISYRLHPFRPRLRIQGMGEHFHHSKWILMQAVLFQIILRADILVIGKSLSAAAVGPYHIAKMVTEIFGAETANALKTSLFPAFSRKDDEGLTVGIFFRTQLAVVWIGAPLCLFISVSAEEIIAFCFDAEFQAAAHLIPVLSVSAIAAITTAPASALLMSRGLTRLIAMRQAMGVVIFVPTLFLLTAWFNVIGTATAVALTACVGAVATTYFALRELGGTFHMIAGPLGRLASSLGIFFFVLNGLDHLLPSAELSWLNPVLTLRMGAIFLLALAFYFGATYALWAISGRPVGYESVVQASLVRLLERIGGRAGDKETK